MRERVVVERLQTEADAREAFCCMSEVPTPWPEALHVCRDWIGANLGRYVEGYHVWDDAGAVAGQLYYAPSEQALVPYRIEPGVAVMYCEWVQRRYQKQGLGQRLFGTFHQDMQTRGFKGILVEATTSEDKMPYQQYLARGFETVYETAGRKLLYLPLTQPEVELEPLASRVQPRRGTPVQILLLSGYLCPFEASTQLAIAQVAREFGDQVALRQESLSPETLARYGVASGIFINGRRKLDGAMTEEAIRQAIIEEL
jgi:GNAT superfamily N-acetyltransferase